jgi:hypothetical protein
MVSANRRRLSQIRFLSPESWGFLSPESWISKEVNPVDIFRNCGEKQGIVVATGTAAGENWQAFERKLRRALRHKWIAAEPINCLIFPQNFRQVSSRYSLRKF